MNARSALYLLLRAIGPRTVWVPSYLCDTLLLPIKATGATCRFYGLSDRLQLESEQWLAEIRGGDVVIFIDYFGLVFDRGPMKAARARGAWVIEDATHALLSQGVGRDADAVLYSLRKLLGLPDGGILSTGRELRIPVEHMEPPPAEWWLGALRSSVLRACHDAGATTREWFAAYQAAEAGAPLGPYSMSTLSETLLRHAFDYDAIATKRRDNYHFLAEGLSDLALLGDLPPGAVPVGFPVRIQRGRDELRHALFERDIFPPWHWPLADVVPDEFVASHALSRQVFTLICDQRYGEADMKRQVDAVRHALVAGARAR